MREALRKIRARNPRSDDEGFVTRSDLQALQEKLLSVFTQAVSVLKLTQVGEVSILRRSRELLLRNSAK